MKHNPTNPPRRRGFTLIELLIVVAIIAILAAIAVPNFLEAQTRSKVSRARADIRSLATALEAYYVDNNYYPPTPYVDTSFDGGVLRVTSNRLSTPVAYITSASILDPFSAGKLGPFQAQERPDIGAGGETIPVINTYACDPAWLTDTECADPSAGRRFYYQCNDDRRRSVGVQEVLTEFAQPVEGKWVMASLGPNETRDLVDLDPGDPNTFSKLAPYDPTNGTISAGDIVRSQLETEGTLQ